MHRLEPAEDGLVKRDG